jgi:hypothetical protein
MFRAYGGDILLLLLFVSLVLCARPLVGRRPQALSTSFSSSSALSHRDVISFMRDGHLFRQSLLAPELVLRLRSAADEFLADNLLAALRHKCEVTLGVEDSATLSLADCKEKLSKVDSSYIPFLQLFNLWRSSEIAREVALSKHMGEIACELLGVPKVRLYQDSLFVKRPGDGATQWHTDLHMTPFDSNDLLTCWIPLQPVSRNEDGGSSLMFASGSQRDFALPYWHDIDCKELEGRYEIGSHGPYELGDCSFHHGWTLHSAPPNSGETTRIAYTVTYVRDGARIQDGDGQLRYPDDEDQHSYDDWIEEVGWGGVASHALLPLVPEDEGN